MALITQSNSSVPFSPLAPFTGVNNATVRLLKNITAAELATLRDGNAVYVESVRDYWKWVPTSTATDDSSGDAAQLRYCNPTVNGANPGRFERLFICSPDWLLQDFFINNTAGVGNNENTGASALVPLNNDSELYQRWSAVGKLALITTPRVVTYLQNPTTETNYYVRCMPGGSVTLLGTPVITKPGTVITAVATQVRTAGSEVAWAVTGVGLGAADVGSYLVITAGTAANIGAYARVLKDNGGGSLRVSPFGKFAVTDGVPFTQVTPAVNDVVQVLTPTTILAGKILFEGMLNVASVASPVQNCVVIDSILMNGGAQRQGNLNANDIPIFYPRSTIQNIGLNSNQYTAPSTGNGAAFHRFPGGGFSGTVDVRRGAFQTYQTGLLTALVNMTSGTAATLSSDTYFQDSSVLMNAPLQVRSLGTAFFDRSAANTAIASNAGAVWRQTGAIPDWGTNNAGHGITISSGAQYVYVTKPTVNGTLGVGREAQIGGTDKVYGAVPYIEGANSAALVLTA